MTMTQSPAVSQRLKVLYIASPRYSGSTLLAFLLSTHPEIATIGERKKFYVKAFGDHPGRQEYCSCGEKFLECPFWQRLREKIASNPDFRRLGHDFTQFIYYRGYRFRTWSTQHAARRVLAGKPWRWWDPIDRQYARMCRANQLLIDAIMEETGKPVYLDSSKPLRQALFLSHIPNYDVSVIQLTRDARGQICSVMGKFNWTAEKAAEQWNREMTSNQELLDKWDVPRIHVTYEELCTNTLDVLERIFDFAGLEWDRNLPEDFRKGNLHIMGNRMRLATTNEIKLDEKWRNKLTPEQLATIDRIAGDTNRFFGYE